MPGNPSETRSTRAVARCTMTMLASTAEKIAGHGLAKGDVLGVARIAAIQGAKRTAELVPYATESLLGSIAVAFQLGTTSLDVEARVESRDGSEVEMEALTACIVAALTVYDMCKAVDRSMSIGPLALVHT